MQFVLVTESSSIFFITILLILTSVIALTYTLIKHYTIFCTITKLIKGFKICSCFTVHVSS